MFSALNEINRLVNTTLWCEKECWNTGGLKIKYLFCKHVFKENVCTQKTFNRLNLLLYVDTFMHGIWKIFPWITHKKSPTNTSSTDSQMKVNFFFVKCTFMFTTVQTADYSTGLLYKYKSFSYEYSGILMYNKRQIFT